MSNQGNSILSLSQAEQDAFILSAEKVLCQKYLYYFARRAWKHAFGYDFVDGMHIAAMCYHYQALWEGQMDTLVVNLPPGCSKSSLTSCIFPSWCWLQDPSAGMWFSSFGQALCDRDSLANRRLITSDWYQTLWGDRFRLLDDQNQKRRFDNDKGGWRLAASIESRVGFGEHPKLLACLPYDTWIHTEDGVCHIGEIVDQRLSVRVESFNHETGKQELDEITKFEKRPGKELYCIDIKGMQRRLELTADHPVFVVGKGYVEAQHLQSDDILKLAEGRRVEVKHVRNTGNIPKFVYNLKIQKNHNYFANGILVHNCDDPLNPKQASSAAMRQTSIDYWANTVASRGIVKGVKRILTAQRLSEEDTSDYVLKTTPDAVHVMIPMEFEPERKCKTNIRYFDIDKHEWVDGWEDPRTEPKQLMWPQGMDEKKVERLKASLHRSHAIAGQLQQRPTAPEGDMFKAEWFPIVDQAPETGKAVRAWDKASSTGSRSDYTAGVLAVESGEDIYIVDVVCDKWERKDRDGVILETGKRDKHRWPLYEIDFEQEPGAGGKDAAAMAADALAREGFRVKIGKPLGKATEDSAGGWEPWCILLSTGRVKLVKGAWNVQFIEQHCAAPFGAHDDMIDAAARAALRLAGKKHIGQINRPLLLVSDEEDAQLQAAKQEKELCTCVGLGCEKCHWTGFANADPMQELMNSLALKEEDDLGVIW